MERPSWDDIWISFAELISQRSINQKFKVGAVVVTSDNTQVLSIGYNGDYKGGPNIIESEEPGQSGLIHAEVNALIKMDYNNPKGKKMYVSLSPCLDCAKLILNSDIKEVIYKNEYRNCDGINLLKSNGIVIRSYNNF
jgi:dCMP deaminase